MSRPKLSPLYDVGGFLGGGGGAGNRTGICSLGDSNTKMEPHDKSYLGPFL